MAGAKYETASIPDRFSSALVAPLLAAGAHAPDPVRRVGMLAGYAESDADTPARLVAFRQGLEALD